MAGYRQVQFYGSNPGPVLGTPRMSMADALMANGANTAPVSSPMEGLARALQGGVGGFQQYAMMKAQGDRRKKAGEDMAAVLAAANAKPWVNPDTGQVSKAPAGGYQGMIAALQDAQNPDLANFAAQVQMAKMEQDATAQQAVAKQEYEIRKALFDKGLEPDGQGGVRQIANYGQALAGLKQIEAMAMIPVDVAKANAMIGPKVNEANAMIGPKVNEATALGPVNARNAGMHTAATESASLPYARPKARATELGKIEAGLTGVPDPNAQPGLRNVDTGTSVPVVNDAQPRMIPAAAALEAAKSGGNIGKTLTPGEKALDTTFSKEVADFKLSGGFADIEKNIQQLRDASAMLADPSKNLTGPILGRTPDAVRSVTNPESISVRERVQEVAQRNLRLILGAQFTEKEGERLISRVYNESLGEEENKRRVDALVTQIEKAAKAKQEAIAHFDKYGTMKGFAGKTYTLADFYPKDRKEDTKGATVTAGADGATGGPSIGSVVDGYRFKGGDPSNQSSWERVR